MMVAIGIVWRKVVLSVFSAGFFEWLFFWSIGMLVDHTKTTTDNEIYDKIKETYHEKD
jgi:hypothetical protein